MSSKLAAGILDPSRDGVVEVCPIGCCVGRRVGEVRPAERAAPTLSNDGLGDEAASTVPKLTKKEKSRYRKMNSEAKMFMLEAVMQ